MLARFTLGVLALGFVAGACGPRPLPLYDPADRSTCDTFAQRVGDDSAAVSVVDRRTPEATGWFDRNALCNATVKLAPGKPDVCRLAMFPDIERARAGSERLVALPTAATVAHQSGKALFWCDLLATRGDQAAAHPVVAAGKAFVEEFGAR